MGMTPKFWKAVGVVGIVSALGVGYYANKQGWIGKPTDVKSSVPVATTIQHFTVAEAPGTYSLPATNVRSTLATCPTLGELAWNATGGINLANGGAHTTADSMVRKYTGGCLNIVRQDDYGHAEDNLAAFANSFGTPGEHGYAFYIIMGDAYPYVSSALNNMIPKDYAVIDAIGLSDGEDQCMLPSAIKNDPKGPKHAVEELGGVLIAAVPRDGDWNICIKFASDNGIPINVNNRVYDKKAFNFLEVNDFTQASGKLIAGAKDTREVVSDGISYGPKSITVNGAAIWTPEDVNVAKNYKGSIVGVASTHDYAGQMAATIIGYEPFMKANRDYVVGLLRATDRAAMTIRAPGNAGLLAMGSANQDIFQEKGANAEYWAKYYVGEDATNQMGEPVHLGGSKVMTLQEARDYFGLRSGTNDTFAAVFRVFKGYDETYYPSMYPKTGKNSIPSYDSVMDLSYLKEALAGIPENTGAIHQELATAAPIQKVISTKIWHIEFATGSAEITSPDVLFQIKDAAIMTSLRVQVRGYTDNTGSPAKNSQLSQRRADAVAHWLNQQAPASFPLTSMESRGYGQSDPVCAANDTPDCKAQNRRVEIVMGK